MRKFELKISEKGICETGITKHRIENVGKKKLRNCETGITKYRIENVGKMKLRNAKQELRNIELKMLENRNREMQNWNHEISNWKCWKNEIAKCETGITKYRIENIVKMKLRNTKLELRNIELKMLEKRNYETRIAKRWIYKIVRQKILKL